MPSMKSRFPFSSFPNGWFLVARTEELPPGGVLSLHRFGQDLVLFRGESGAPHLLDAHCPHLGAHLGHGGCVKGEDILCPFHAWRFNGAGQCTGIPYAQKVPRQAKLRSWPVHETDGLILAWHHAEGLPAIPPVLPKPNDGSWSPGQWRQWKVRTHVQEIIENGVDTAHFRPIHKAAADTTCEASITEQGVLRTVLQSALDLQGTNEPDKMVPSRTELLAFGLGITLSYNQAGPMELLILVCHTPLDEEFVDMRARVQVKRLPSDEMTAAIESQVAQNVVENVERDVRIWENKVYRNVPVLCDGDGPIGLARRWAKQFYSGKGVLESTDTEQAAERTANPRASL
jgi:phenylpropionate dioxygenase-like ring-hydroxylating dioxygenase large terminal subunit